MSLAWSFLSYSPDRFSAFFGGDAADAEEVVVQAVTWDEEAWDDPSLPAHLARRIARQGIDYGGLTPVEASLLDDLVPILFSPEGMGDDLKVEECGLEGPTPAEVRHLLDRAGTDPPAHLTAFLKGRRAGSTEPARCGYVLLDPAEVVELRTELEALLGAGAGEDLGEDANDAFFRNELLPLLDDLSEEGLALAAFLS